jgi:hypothetical protein
MTQLVQASVFYYNDQDSGLTDTSYCFDSVLGDECPSGCGIDISDGGGNTSYSSSYQAFTYSLNNTCTEEIDIQLTYDAFTFIGNKFDVYVDNVLLWTSGCVTGTGFVNLTIPAGSYKILYYVTGACSGGAGDAWALTVVCL